MEIPYSVEEIQAACNELIGANGLPECYLRPVAFYGYGELGVRPRGCPVEVAIISWPWGTYLGEDALENGIRAKISSWERIGPNVIPHVSKATGVYLNSLLAVQEATAAGYDEAILLTARGLRRGRLRREHLHRQERRDRDARSLRRRSSRGSRATRSSRSPRTSATRSRRRT